jgi:hypothetical protein
MITTMLCMGRCVCLALEHFLVLLIGNPFKIYKYDGGSDIGYVSLQALICFNFFFSNVLNYSTAYASFGGLLMSLTGPTRQMTGFVVGDSVYLLLRKV